MINYISLGVEIEFIKITRMKYNFNICRFESIFKGYNVQIPLILFLNVFILEVNAQMRSACFWVEGAVHNEDNSKAIDIVQSRANAFIFEGKHDDYYKWKLKKYREHQRVFNSFSKKIESVGNENEKDSLRLLQKKRSYEMRKIENPYPRHDYVVLIKPSFAPTCGFAVDKDKIVYMNITKYKLKKMKVWYKVESSTVVVPQEICSATRSMMDNIVNSAVVSTDGRRILDGTTFSVIVGRHPTHMVSSKETGDVIRKAAIELLQSICDAAKNNNVSVINAQLQEIKRLESIYHGLR